MPLKSNGNEDRNKKQGRICSCHLEQFTHKFVKWTGSATGFVAAFLSIFIWLLGGWYYNFSATWESGFVIFTGIFTFLMVFLIQRSQIKESMALQIKLNELITASQNASNQLINLEERSEQEISEVKETHDAVKNEEETPPSLAHKQRLAARHTK